VDVAATQARPGLDLLLDWVAALRVGDLAAVADLLCRDVVWQGLRQDLTCRGRGAVLDALKDQTPVRFEIDALELWSAPRHMLLGTRSAHLPQPEGVTLRGQIYNVFECCGDRFARIDDFAARSDAFTAAGLDESAMWR
jgi:hypothetical protein